MKKWYIKIPICEVWEILNKPWRFYGEVIKEVEKLPPWEYDMINFNDITKEEIIRRLKIMAYIKE